MADEAGVQRLVPRAAARNQRDLARLQRLAPHELAVGAEGQDVGVGGGKAVEALGQDSVDAVHELLHSSPPGFAQKARHFVHEFAHRLVECGVGLVVAEVRHQQRQVPHLAPGVADLEPPRMRLPVGAEEGLALSRTEVADREQRRQVALRNGRGVARAGHLGDEAAVLAERIGEALPRARWPRLEDARQHQLIGPDVLAGLVGLQISPSRCRSGRARDCGLGESQLRRRDRKGAQPGLEQAPESSAGRRRRRRRG